MRNLFTDEILTSCSFVLCQFYCLCSGRFLSSSDGLPEKRKRLSLHQLYFVVQFINILNILLVALNLNLNVCSGDIRLISQINCSQTTYEVVVMTIAWPGIFILILVEYFVWSALDICHEQLTRDN